jgi:hypothetical protein
MNSWHDYYTNPPCCSATGGLVLCLTGAVAEGTGDSVGTGELVGDGVIVGDGV